LGAAGFDFIRIPVDPGPFLSFSGERRTKLLTSLFDAVDQAVSAKLSVIVNVQPNDGTHYWTSRRMFESRNAPAFGPYLALIEDIAAGLRRFDAERVALEPVNEPPQACDSMEWNAVQFALLSRARAVAPHLTLLATGACGSMVRGIQQIDGTQLRKLQPVFFTFHFYEPYLFSHQGARWMREPIYRWLNGVPWPASTGNLAKTLALVETRMGQDTSYPAEDKSAVFKEVKRVLVEYFAANPGRSFIDGYFDQVKSWARSNFIPPEQVILGEFGAVRSGGLFGAAGASDRARYVHDVREAAETSHFPWAFWNLFDSMGLMDDSTRAFDPSIVQALGLTVPVH
jgi:hypothetical protein